MAKRECQECGKVFEYTPPENFPDKRKYCDECSAKKKAEWESKKGEKASQDASTQPQQSNMAQHDVIINRAEKPHSFEFGKPGARHKIYYNTVEELKAQIEELKKAGLHEEQDMDVPIQNV